MESKWRGLKIFIFWQKRWAIFFPKEGRFSSLSQKCLYFPFFWANGSHNKSVGMLGLSGRENGEDWQIFIFWQKRWANPLPLKKKKGRFSNLSQKCLYFPFFWANESHNNSVGHVGYYDGWENGEDWKLFIFWQKRWANPLPFFRKRSCFLIFQYLP